MSSTKITPGDRLLRQSQHQTTNPPPCPIFRLCTDRCITSMPVLEEEVRREGEKGRGGSYHSLCCQNSAMGGHVHEASKVLQAAAMQRTPLVAKMDALT